MIPGDLCIAMSAMNRTGFDFVGKYVGEDDTKYILEKPLVLNYADENHTLQNLLPLHLPLGVVDVLGQRTTLDLPKAGIAYCVGVPENGSDDWLHEEYRKFFGQAY